MSFGPTEFLCENGGNLNLRYSIDGPSQFDQHAQGKSLWIILLMRGQQVGANPRHHQRGVRPKGEEPGGRPLQSNWTIPCDKSFVDDLEWNGVL